MNTKNKVLEEARLNLELRKYEDEIRKYEVQTSSYPEDYSGWAGLAKANLIHKIRGGKNSKRLSECIEFVDAAKILNNRFDEDAFWREIVNVHGEELLVEKERHQEYPSDKPCTILNLFDTELICSNEEDLHPLVRELQGKISEQYAEKFLSGKLLLFYTGSNFWGRRDYDCNHIEGELPYNNPVMNKLWHEGLKNAGDTKYKRLYANIGFALGIIRISESDGFVRIEIANAEKEEETLKYFDKIKDFCDEARSICAGIKEHGPILREVERRTDAYIKAGTLPERYFYSYKILQINPEKSSIKIEYKITEVSNYTNPYKDEHTFFIYPKNVDAFMEILREFKNRKDEGRCVYCGGEFVVFLRKTCRNCGTPKDY